LKHRRGGIFSANPKIRASDPLGRLFALIAIHQLNSCVTVRISEREARNDDLYRITASRNTIILVKEMPFLDLDQAGGGFFSGRSALIHVPSLDRAIMTLNIVDILHNCALFAEVPASGFQRLAAIARLCQFRKGQMVFRENDACPGVFVVGQGLVRVFKSGAGGKEQVLHMVGPG
jgi:hypothetical protein